MKAGKVIALLLGLFLVVGLIAWQGAGTLASTLARAGWQILWLAPWYLVPLGFATLTWWLLFPKQQRPRPLATLYSTWIGLAINWLMPVAQIGGELVKAQLVARRGIEGTTTLATIVVDKTIQVATQGAYVLLGLILFFGAVQDQSMVTSILLAAAVFGCLSYLMWRVQRKGAFQLGAKVLKRLLSSDWGHDFEQRASEIDGAIREIYQRRRMVVRSFACRLFFRMAMAGEVWLAMRFLGQPVDAADSIILESLGQAVRMAAFIIPGGLGAQEGALVGVGLMLGIPADTALALSVCKRGRELSVGLPALIVWQWENARALTGLGAATATAETAEE